MELPIELEEEIMEKYKEELVCPKCQSELIHKDYIINRNTIIKLMAGYLLGVITMLFYIFLN